MGDLWTSSEVQAACSGNNALLIVAHHPVVISIKFAPHLSIVGELACHRIPEPPTASVQLCIAAQRIQQGPVMVALVSVIRTVHSWPGLSPDERAVGSRVTLLKSQRSLVHRRDQRTLG